MSELVVFRELSGPHGTLRGIVHLANHQDKGKCAIILHGYFSSCHIGPYRLYVQMARILTSHGYDVWRFDCHGFGDSDGDFEDASYWTEVEDYRAITNEALSDKQVESVVLVGHSMGGNIAVRLAAFDQRIRRLLLVSPTVGKLTWRERLFHTSSLEELSRQGETIRKSLRIRASFLSDLESEDIFELSQQVKASATILQGASDEFYSLQNAARLAGMLRAGQVEVVPEGDHNYLRGKSRELLLKAFEKRVKSWSQ